ncbi:hypothetical protein P3T23_004401 [Paraburkholderia sp. GAS448]|uniref:hypothetical protein n=1 Tax=Paraburkholderia sp. GAS448 TaxID=3035136 RepID=UPI003D1F29D9
MKGLSKEISDIKEAFKDYERLLAEGLLQSAAYAHLKKDFGPANELLRTVPELDREAVVAWFEKADLVVCRTQSDVAVSGVNAVDDVQQVLRTMKKVPVFPDDSPGQARSVFIRTVSGGLPSLGKRAK